ncbi:hypothetical protein M3J09_001542, partial [Ascochyta lentis]
MMLGRALPPALFSLLLAARAAATPYDFKDNYNDPAPSPEDGPPASFHATRDRQRLPYEICGLVGGYVFTVLIWGVLLLTIGRKMRRKALDPPPALEFEQELKPIRGAMETPISPSSMRSATSWMRKFKRSESLSGSTPVSPVVQSPMSFDQKVLDADKARAQDDMERLYAAVMDHDAKKHSRQASREVEEQVAPPIIRSERRRPSAISTTHRAPTDSSPVSPIKAIYPPDYTSTNMSVHSRNNSLRNDSLRNDSLRNDGLRNDGLRNDGLRNDGLRNNSLRVDHPPPSPRSILSKPRRLSSASKQEKSARFNLKNLRISGPIQSYGGAAPDDEARTPLSPRFYPDPGAPPSPPTQPTSPTTPYSPTEPAELSRAHSLGIPPPRTPTPHPPTTPNPLSNHDPNPPPPLPQLPNHHHHLHHRPPLPRNPNHDPRPPPREPQSPDPAHRRSLHALQSVYALHAHYARDAAFGDEAREEGEAEGREGAVGAGERGEDGAGAGGDVWGCLL